MKLSTIILSTNSLPQKSETFAGITKERLLALQLLSTYGGFQRFNISLYDETQSKRTKKSKWFKFNEGQAERAIQYFFDKNKVF